jgi:hypothetical protein
MNYKILLFLIVFISIPSYSQKKYLFDYMMEYYRKDTDTSKVKKEYILTNSKDKSYTLRVFEKDSSNFDLSFLNLIGVSSKMILDKNSFSEAEFITSNCDFISGYSYPSKFKTQDFNFIKKSDTLVGGEYCSHYIFKCNDPKKEKRKKLGTLHFILKKDASCNLLFFDHPTVYEEWKSEGNILNGILQEMFLELYDKNKNISFYKLKQYAKINKYLIVPEECDYTKSSKQ